ncbi:MAG TPA: hypothetical protein VJ917_11845 [Saprospiraceae bacterium]|nr:hypothetical protein [Saprospiraceae bacterium]
MKKKDIQVFSMSFLDLLSGALAAVIILFIIVPKMDAKSKEAIDALEELDSLEMNIEELDSLMKSLEGAVDSDTYERVMEQIESMEETIEELREQVEDLQEQLQQCEEQVEQMEEEIEQMEEVVEQLQTEVEDLRKYKQWMENCGFTLEDGCPVEPPQTTFLAISTGWEANVDVDLWIETPFGKTFSYKNVSFPYYPGILSRDATKGPGIELFEILNPPSGVYNIYLNLYSGSSPVMADLRIFYPKGAKEYKNIRTRGSNRRNNIFAMKKVVQIRIYNNGEYTFSN